MASVNGDGDQSPEHDHEERIRALKFTGHQCSECKRSVAILNEGPS